MRPSPMRGPGRSKRAAGWTLVLLIVILSSAFVAMAGSSLALSESRRVTSLRQNEIRAFYLAQAGIMRAIYDFRSGGVLTGEHVVEAGPAPGTDDDDVFIIGLIPTDDVGVDMSNAKIVQPGGGEKLCGVSRDRLQSFKIKNTGSDPVTITHMIVTWEPVMAGEGVIRIDLSSSGADWASPGCAPVAAGTPIDIEPDRTLGSSPPHFNVRVWFATTNMETKEYIEVTFLMADGSQVSGRFDPDESGQSGTRYRVSSTGEARRGAFPLVSWRTLEAEYQLDDPEDPDGPGRILWYRELPTRNSP